MLGAVRPGSAFRITLATLAGVMILVFFGGSAWARAARKVPDPSRLQVHGAPDAFYYRPFGRGLRPVIMYLHGRGANPAEDCRKWAHVARRFGWVVCPQGPEDRGNGTRGWNNNAAAGEVIVQATLHALRAKFHRRVQLYGNVLVGFSEGAFVAMQVGIHEPHTWNRWLILAANDQYWYGRAPPLLHQNRRKIHRVFLFTGETDEVAPNTKKVADILHHEHVRCKTKIAPGMGHEVPGDRMITNYRRPLMWLLAG